MAKDCKIDRFYRELSLDRLSPDEVQLLRTAERELMLSFQRLRRWCEMIVDLRMWQERPFREYFARATAKVEAEHPRIKAREKGEKIHSDLERRIDDLLAEEVALKGRKTGRGEVITPQFVEHRLVGSPLRDCNALSTEGVCCGLKVLNIVANCAYDCSYCILKERFGSTRITFPSNLEQKLSELVLDRNRIQRIGTGEYSDSLLFGNRGGLLDILCAFVAEHENVLLELKTKSTNIGYLLDHQVPTRIIVSWSLNATSVITGEEGNTPSWQQRLDAARKIADRGLKIGFHFHPLIRFQGWQEEYGLLYQAVLDRFRAEEIAFISFGCLTFPVTFPRALRRSNRQTVILRMPTELTVDGKITAATELRRELYRHGYVAFKPWHDRVFIYFCMEFQSLWDEIIGFHYPNVESMSEAMNAAIIAKLPPNPTISS